MRSRFFWGDEVLALNSHAESPSACSPMEVWWQK